MGQRNDRKFVGMCIQKSKQVKGKFNCSLSKQYKNLEKLLKMLLDCLVQWKGRKEKRKGKKKKKRMGERKYFLSCVCVFGYEEKQKGKM